MMMIRKLSQELYEGRNTDDKHVCFFEWLEDADTHVYQWCVTTGDFECAIPIDDVFAFALVLAAEGRPV